MENVKGYAQKYIAAGLNPLPIGKGKVPLLPEGHTYLTQKHDNLNVFNSALKIALAAGDVSDNLLCIDFDQKDGNDVSQIFNQFIESKYFKSIEDNCAVISTPSGGYHIILKAEQPIRTHKLARFQDGTTMIEVRGSGAYFLTYPTDGYVYIQGLHIENIEHTDQETVNDLLKYARSFSKDDIKETNKHKGIWPERWPDNTPDGKYNNECADEAKQILIDNNWQYIETRRDGIEYWTRPGKNPEDGISATWGRFFNCFYVWSQNVPDNAFEAEKGYTPFDIFCTYKHNKDWKAAKDELRQRFGMNADNAKHTKVTATIETHTGESKEVPPGTSITTAEMKDIYTVVLHKDGETDAAELINEITEYYQAGKAVYVQDPGTAAHHAGYNVFLSIQWDQYNDAKDDRQRDIIRDAIIAFTDNLNGADKGEYEAAGCNILDISADHWSDHLKLIREREAERRQTERRADIRAKIQEAANQGNDEAILKLSRQLEATSAARADFTKQNTIKDLIAERQEEKGRIYSGYIIEKSRLYFPAADVMLVAGYTGMNKTAFLVNLALNAIKNGDEKSKYLFLTMEQSWADVMERFINTYIDISNIGNQINGYTIPNEATIRKYYQSGQDPKHINENVRGEFLKRENEFIQNIWHRINIQYNEDDALSIIETIRRYKEATPELAAVFVDQISFLSLTSEVKKRDRINSRQEELKYIGEKMKSFFKQIKIPMIAAIQISRQGHERGQANGYNLSSLAESGDNERIAHTVVAIEDYNYRTEPGKQREALEITILKRRGDVINIKEQKKYNAATRAVYNEDYNIAKEDANGKITSTKETIKKKNNGLPLQ